MLEDLLAIKHHMAFIQEQEGRTAVDLGWEENFIAGFGYDVPRSAAVVGFDAFVNA
jgi:hypothetical protein